MRFDDFDGRPLPRMRERLNLCVPSPAATRARPPSSTRLHPEAGSMPAPDVRRRLEQRRGLGLSRRRAQAHSCVPPAEQLISPTYIRPNAFSVLASSQNE